MAPDRDLAAPVAWRRSQRASAERRARAARTRRRRLRGRACTLLALALTGAAASGAVAADATAPGGTSSTASSGLPAGTIRALQQKLGIAADGVYGSRTRAAVRRFQRRHRLVVDGIAGPQTLAALGLRARSAGRSATTRVRTGTSATLARIAECESGGDPTAVSSNGAFRGKYQFSLSTWRAMGGTGDPAKAPEAEQDRRAAQLLARAGTSPWPACGG